MGVILGALMGVIGNILVEFLFSDYTNIWNLLGFAVSGIIFLGVSLALWQQTKKYAKNTRTENRKEKYQLSKFTQTLFFVVVFSSMVLRSIPVITILFCFLILSTGFDAWKQGEERKERGEK